MNGSESDDDNRDRNESIEADERMSSPSPAAGDEETHADPPFVAKLISTGQNPGAAAAESDTETEPTIRVGSPFRVDPPPQRQVVVQQASGEAVYADYGPFLYTSMGAASAAIVVLAFAILGYFWFPAGGALVTMLGTLLSLVGVFSEKRFRLAAITALPLHAGLFFLCYMRALV
ncbi:hypothetical protein [Rhodopirellula sp. MGV]|uniref:hypothetical protein n=1 Tax=Rhodopirellula sp. MGV TaxID=2023130 RepID=UPI000B95CF6A|nr:hypothetical protein [Rhodopirellula sp. MGV]OYP28228.1 hypothetical protein CGZ80_27275 [Rhodopirellula sp. MGV]PNY34230.1 hypothetical protein C2E31_24360 [Rhodopirellula baltica]